MALLGKLDAAYSSGKPDSAPLPDDALAAFMRHCEQRIGEATFRTPRTTITAFIGLLAVLEQNPEAGWKSLLHQTQIVLDKTVDTSSICDELVSLTL